MVGSDQNIGNAIAKLRRDLERVLHVDGESINLDLYISSITEYNPFNSTEEIADWLREMNSKEYFHVELIPLSKMRQWSFSRLNGDLSHESGGFFSIRGLKIRTNVGPVKRWAQPIILQPEIGVLGIAVKKINGILYLLMQAKAEPGNINTFQLSPTVQATRSNFMRLHGGKSTRYLDYFLDRGRALVLVDQLQSEQGARFYRKSNRNIIVRIRDDEDMDLDSNFCWLTLGQIKRLMLQSNTVNMDARSVISCISFDPERKSSKESIRTDQLRDCLECSPLVKKPVSELGVEMMKSGHSNTFSLHSLDTLLQDITHEKFQTELTSQLIPLNEINDWCCTPSKISHVDGKFFSVIGVRVLSSSREVSSWDQPIIRQMDSGIIGFIIRKINNVCHFLVQLKMESGNRDLLELASTVQCITGSYMDGNLPDYVADMLDSSRGKIVIDTLQSEEGGRFYREENQNIVLFCNDTLSVKTSPGYLWMTLSQLKLFLKFNNYLNVQARSLLAII